MKNNLSRRKFIQAGTMATGGLLASRAIQLNAQPYGSTSKKVAPSDRLRFGIIGIGMEGSGLLTGAVTLPGIECVAASDLYDGRHTLAKEITGNPNLFITRKYKELLDRKDIDCIIAAVPDHWHKRCLLYTSDAADEEDSVDLGGR